MIQRLTRRAAFALSVLDAGAVTVAILVAYVLRFRFEVGAAAAYPTAPLERYLEAAPVVVLFHLIALRARGLHDHVPPLGIDVVERTLGAASIATLGVLALSFFYRDFSYSRGAIAIAWALSVVLLPLPRLALLARKRRRHAAGLDLVPALVIGTAPSPELLARLRDRALFGLALVGRVRPAGAGANGAGPGALSVLGDTAELGDLIASHRAREVLIVDDLPKLELLDVIATCERLDVEPRLVPAVHDLCVTEADLGHVHGVPFIAIREQRVQAASLAAKRAFDVLASAALLVLLAPLVAALAVAIRRSSPGPALFAQPRVGEGGRVFRMWKLRTMVVDAEARLRYLVDLDALREPVFKLAVDPRVTSIGRFLRRSSLDELPQLWNVLKGDMSLVGPRPEEEAVVLRYDRHQRRRLKARPGITGLQQVEARASESLDERVRLDVLYIRRRTFLFDLWILARTPGVVLSGKGAR